MQSGLEVLPSQYPPMYRDDSVKADFFGTTVYDPYRWLENTDSNETIACARPNLMPHIPNTPSAMRSPSPDSGQLEDTAG